MQKTGNILVAESGGCGGGQFFPVCEESPWEFSIGGVVCIGFVSTASLRLEHEVVGVDRFD